MSERSVDVLFDGMQLVTDVVQDLAAPGMTPVLAIERALESHLHQSFAKAFSGVLIKPPTIRFHSMYFKRRYATLPELLKVGYETWYPEIVLATTSADAFDDVSLSSELLDLIPINYGAGVSRIHQVKKKVLKKQTNHVVRINHIKVSPIVVQAVVDQLKLSPPSQPLIANFDPEAISYNHRAVSFDHMLTAERCLCLCSKPFHDAGGEVLRGYLSDCSYKAGICHLCIARVTPEDKRYGSSVEANFEGYIDQVMFDLGSDRRTARAEIMHILGLSRWQRESALYGIVRELFPSHQVLREASPAWLGRMRIDIYLPELRLAIEHQGEQHFRPLPIFGGEEAHIRVVERDRLKRQLCAENGVEVIDFRFDSALTKAAVKHRLRTYWELANDGT